MPKDFIERRTYRKSPGRQYGYDYDPLRSRGEGSHSGSVEHTEQSTRWPTSGPLGSRSGPLSAQRPDPRRTRQLLRKSIIAGKTRGAEEDEEMVEQRESEQYAPRTTEGQEGFSRRHTTGSTRQGSRSGSLRQPYLPSTDMLMEGGTQSKELEEGGWSELDAGPHVDPDHGYEEPLAVPLEEYPEAPAVRAAPPPVPYARRSIPARASRRPTRSVRPVDPREYEEEYDEYDEYDDYYEEEEDRPTVRRKGKKGKVTRRVLLGMGAAAAVGTGIAIYEYGPKLPQAIGDAGTNIEHQLEDAFKRGVAQGADNARKEFITALENLEGFTLDGAITAARLTRVAYDVFVSPVIQIGSTVAADFLNSMLKAFKTARMMLAGVYQDNTTLQAIQKVMESWVKQVTNMPKQLNAITQADLDGAQAYLRALKAKIEEEKAKLNNPGGTPTPSSGSNPQARPTPKSK